MVIDGKTYKLRKKENVIYESEEEEYVNGSEDNDESEEGDSEVDDEVDEVNKKKKTKTFESLDPNLKKIQRSLNVRRHREEKNMRMLKNFEKDYDKDEYLKHGEYYWSVNKYLREKPQGSRINRIKMYEAEKKKRNGVSPVAREVIRKTGPKKEVIVVDDDLPPKIINNSIKMLAMEREQTEEERTERALTLLMEKAKEEELRQKTSNRRERNPTVDRKREFATNVLNYLAINKGESFDPKKWTYTNKNGKTKTIANDDENEVYSCSSDADLSDYRKSYTDMKRKKKDNTKLPLTENGEELYREVRSLIERGRIRRANTGCWKKKTQLSSYIDIDKLDINDENVARENGEHMENYLTNDDMEYLDRNDMDFQKYYLYNQKSFAGINLGKGERRYDQKEDTLPYEMKIMFLASKVCQLRTQYWSAKYYDINNRFRDWMYSETIWLENPTAEFTPDPKVVAEKKLDYQLQGREGRRQMRMKERGENRKKMLENDMQKLFNKQTILYKNLRNLLNEKFEREQFEKQLEEKKMWMDLEKIPYFLPNPIYLDWKEKMIPVVAIPLKQEDCYTYEEYRTWPTMWKMMKNRTPLQIKNPHLIRTKNIEKRDLLKKMHDEQIKPRYTICT
jgi:hypothetical protein